MIALLNVAALGQSGQSLGDIARANREKQQEQAAAGEKPKLITNADVPSNPPGISESNDAEPMTMVSGVSRHFDGRYVDQQNRAQEHAGEQWRDRILGQENRIASLRAYIDQMTASMHSVGSAQSEGPYNRYQARRMQRLAQMQEMLEEQERKLSMLQNAARRAGMHTSVYDP